MKLPFYTVLGPLVWSSEHTIRKICDCPLLQYSEIYVVLLGLIGTILSVYDIWRIIHCGQSYSVPNNSQNPDKNLNPEVQRDFKLIGLTLSSEFYIFLLIGCITKNPVFFLPYLIMHSVAIVLELLTSALKLALRDFTFRKYWIWGTLIMMINWICVFRTFTKLLTTCDI